MPEFVKLGKASDLPAEGEAKEFTVNGRVVCVANVSGAYAAMDNVCVHRGGPLGQGIVEGGKVICPWHGWAYDPKSGEAAHSPAAKVAVFPIKVEGDDVLVEM
jgi:nitrite reductase (NADH) small subunit